MLDAFRFAAVITDLNLPDSTGIDTLNRLLAVGIGGPVIVLTHCDNDSPAWVRFIRGFMLASRVALYQSMNAVTLLCFHSGTRAH